MRTALMLSIALAATAAPAEEVWRWVDSDGVTHYSDRPVPGAEKIDLKVQTYSPPPQPAAPVTATTDDEEDDATLYRNFEIWKPAMDEAIVNTAGSVPVRLRVEPGLRDRHSIYLYLDGKRIDGLSLDSLDFQLSNVPRGTHTLSAMIADDEGNAVVQAPQIVFHVVQTSVANPPVGPALRPPPKPQPRGAAPMAPASRN